MDVISRLQAVDFMRELTAQDLIELAQITRRQRFVAGEDILKQGDFTDKFFVIDEGQVHFRQTDIEGFEKALGSEGPGGYFGKQMFTSQEPSEFTAEAIGQATLFVLASEDFEKLSEQHPDLLRHMPLVVDARRRLTLGLRWLTPGEIVSFTTRHHALLLIQVMLLPVLAGLAMIALVLGLNYLGTLRAVGIPGLEVGLIAVALLIATGWGVITHADWADDDFIVTNKRVVHSERVPFLSEARNEIPIAKIQSITVAKTSWLQNLFNISTVEVRSAGKEESAIKFDNVANADKIRQIIERQRALLRARQQAEDRERFRKRVGSELQHYVFRVPLDEVEPTRAPAQLRGFRQRAGAAWHSMFGNEFKTGGTITYRKHWIALLRRTQFGLLALILLGLVGIFYRTTPVLQIIPGQGFWGVWLVLAVISFGYTVWEWEDWRNDIYRLTDTAIIDIERLPFGLDSKETTALLVNVQDAKTLRPGVIRSMFNFGNVEISTAGGGPPMVFHDVSRPHEIQTEIFRRLEGFRLKQRERETSLQSRNVIDALVAYHRLLMQERHTEPTALPEGSATTITEVVSAPAAPEAPPAAPLPVVRDQEAEFTEFPPSTAFPDES